MLRRLFWSAFLFLLPIASSVFADDNLIGGDAVPSDRFPQIIYISVNGGHARCSATIVSPEESTGVILTAGHCAESAGPIKPVSFLINFPDRVELFSAICQQSPQYKSTKMDVDMALCKADRPLLVHPASISSIPVKLGELLMLTGYGCTEPRTDERNAHGGNDGVLRVGLAKVTQTADKDTWFYTTANRKAPAAGCSGDSGSSVLRLPVPPAKGSFKAPVVVGVNSRADMKALTLATAMSRPEAQAFLKSWAAKNDVRICGVNSKC